MTEDEYNKLKTERTGGGPQPVDLASMLQNKADRTLIWGYTPEKDSFHVYLQDQTIVRLVFAYKAAVPKEMEAGTEYFPATMVPAKRVYAEASDAEFCGLLRRLGVDFSFAPFNPERAPKQFHGETLEDFGMSLADFPQATPAAPGMR